MRETKKQLANALIFADAVADRAIGQLGDLTPDQEHLAESLEEDMVLIHDGMKEALDLLVKIDPEYRGIIQEIHYEARLRALESMRRERLLKGLGEENPQ